MNNEIDHDYTNEVVCPHCGYEHHDSWEFPDGGEYDCANCGEPFLVERIVDVTYCTSKLP